MGISENWPISGLLLGNLGFVFFERRESLIFVWKWGGPAGAKKGKKSKVKRVTKNRGETELNDIHETRTSPTSRNTVGRSP